MVDDVKTLRVLTYREDGVWLAHCLDLDIIADGETESVAVSEMLSLIDFWVGNRMEDGDVQTPSRPELFAEFRMASEEDAPRTCHTPAGHVVQVCSQVRRLSDGHS